MTYTCFESLSKFFLKFVLSLYLFWHMLLCNLYFQPHWMMTYQSIFHTVFRIGVIYKIIKGIFDDETLSEKRPSIEYEPNHAWHSKSIEPCISWNQISDNIYWTPLVFYHNGRGGVKNNTLSDYKKHILSNTFSVSIIHLSFRLCM